MVGQALDSMLFYPIAFLGIWTATEMAKIVLFNWFFKVSVEVFFTPLTYAIVAFLKRQEREDYFDEHTNFSPFTLSE